MLTFRQRLATVLVLLLAITAARAESAPCRSFKVTVDIPVSVVRRMARDPAWMRSSWRTIGSRLHVDAVVIECCRPSLSATGADLSRAKHCFLAQHVAVAGGNGQFNTLDYALPQDRAIARRISALTAWHFNEFILDDLYFFNTKSRAAIAAKGKLTWSQHRMRTMDWDSRNLIFRPARAANPKVRVIHHVPGLRSVLLGHGLRSGARAKDLPGDLDWR